jgi:hypothetical protein
MENNQKNVKISEKHHQMLKVHCDKNGLKMYKVLEKFIEDYCKPKKKDIYGDD